VCVCACVCKLTFVRQTAEASTVMQENLDARIHGCTEHVGIHCTRFHTQNPGHRTGSLTLNAFTDADVDADADANTDTATATDKDKDTDTDTDADADAEYVNVHT